MSTTESTADLQDARAKLGIAGKDWPQDAAGDEQQRRAQRDERDEASISQRAENGDELEDQVPEEELYPLGTLEGDPKFAAAKLQKAGIIPAGVQIEATVSIRAAEVTLLNGLLDPEKPGSATVRYVYEKTEVPLFRDKHTGEINKAKIRQIVRPVHVEETPGSSESPED